MTRALGAAARYWEVAAALGAATEGETRIASTPSETVFARDRMRLARYRPLAPARDAPPLIVVHGLVGRGSLIDLDEKRSLARTLLAGGVDLFATDWGSPSRADLGLAFEDYVDDYLPAAAAHVAALTGRAPAVLGICEGGVFCACFAARAPDALAGLALAVTPIDFHAEPQSLLARWARGLTAEQAGKLIDALGRLPGGMMGAIFEALEPGRTMAKYGVDLLAGGPEPERLRAFLRTERWLFERPHHPAAAAKQLMTGLYQENRLVAGRFALDGRPVDLGAIRAPVLAAFGLHDHIVPPVSARAIGPALRGAPYRELPIEAGHVGVFVSARARGRLAAELIDWLDGPCAA